MQPQDLPFMQVVVQGIPWKFTWKELRPMFEECGAIDRAEVVYGRDGRSRVRFTSTRMTAVPSVWHFGSTYNYFACEDLHERCLCFTFESSLRSAVQGYGTVRFESAEAAATAIEKFHGTDCEGRTLTVKLDQYA